jgi:quercetin dioxygenase-like cupin family protein
MSVAETNVGGLKIITLESRGGYQRQLCIVPPRTVIPRHSHNNVRTNIIFLAGHVVFHKGDKSIELSSPQDSYRGFIIDPGEDHGCHTLGQDFIFLTEQYWLDNEPVRSLHLNWRGEPINQDHANQLSVK